MIYNINKLEIAGVFLLVPNIFSDERGRITKTFHRESFDTLKLECDWGESLITENYQKGILRGFHFQAPPYCQAKTICCITGAIDNWVLDLRKGSATYGQTEKITLDAQSRQILYVPRGMANCYYIKEDNTIISYNLTNKYKPAFANGINWKSMNLDINGEVFASEKDNSFSDFDSFESPFIYGENC